jgi:hypothetical protein
MNVNCDQFDALLLEGDHASLALAADHAAGCAACMETLTAWNDLAATAASMRVSWDSDLLWPRIARALAADESDEAPRTAVITRNWWLAAAAMLIAISIGGTAWYGGRAAQRDFDHVILRASALDEVTRAEQLHLAAIRQLERVAQPALEERPSPLMVNYKEKLMLLDDAIAECETSIEQNQQNAHLRKQLLWMYSQKQQTLRQIVREANHVTVQ